MKPTSLQAIRKNLELYTVPFIKEKTTKGPTQQLILTQPLNLTFKETMLGIMNNMTKCTKKIGSSRLMLITKDTLTLQVFLYTNREHIHLVKLTVILHPIPKTIMHGVLRITTKCMLRTGKKKLTELTLATQTPQVFL